MYNKLNPNSIVCQNGRGEWKDGMRCARVFVVYDISVKNGAFFLNSMSFLHAFTKSDPAP